MRNNFVFYTSYYECIKELPEELQGSVYKAIVEYAMEQKEPNLTGIANGIFKVIKPTLDKSQKQYENGIKGGRPRREENPSETQTETQTKPNGNPTETESITQQETQTETQPISNKNLDKNKKNKQESKQEQEDIERKIKKESTVLTDSEIVDYIKAHIKNEIVCKKFIDYANNRKAMGKKYAIRTQATLDLNIGNLKKWASTVEEAVEILEYSIANNYQGLFNPKKKTITTPTTNTAYQEKQKVSSAEVEAWTS